MVHGFGSQLAVCWTKKAVSKIHGPWIRELTGSLLDHESHIEDLWSMDSRVNRKFVGPRKPYRGFMVHGFGSQQEVYWTMKAVSRIHGPWIRELTGSLLDHECDIEESWSMDSGVNWQFVGP